MKYSAIGGDDDDRRAAGEIGQVEDVRQRGDDERVEPARRNLLADGAMTALSAGLGACDMDGVEPLLERRDRLHGALASSASVDGSAPRRSVAASSGASAIIFFRRRWVRLRAPDGSTCGEFATGRWRSVDRASSARAQHRRLAAAASLRNSSSHLLERQPVVRRRRLRRLDDALEIGDGPLQIGIVARQRERRAVLGERFGERAAPVMDLGEAADGGEIFRRALEDDLELGLRVVERVRARSARGPA